MTADILEFKPPKDIEQVYEYVFQSEDSVIRSGICPDTMVNLIVSGIKQKLKELDNVLTRP